ncbi:MAG: radical SAM protein [Thermoguttaceae bacterium]|jgi:hypothetical protein|nr:radical SAM protein [Thermoguttaceae bacterium]
MHVVLWDPRNTGVWKDLAGGMGAARCEGWGGLAGRLVRFWVRERRPPPLLLAHLVAALRRRGHTVEYVCGRFDRPADLFILRPALSTLAIEREAAARLLATHPRAKAMFVGPVASTLPQALDGLGAMIVKGDAEQLYWTLDEVLERPGATVQLGWLEDLDRLPLPDWSPFLPRSFRLGREFARFPSTFVEQSRGCPCRCDFCSHAHLDGVRFREPEAVVDEIRHGVHAWGFRSFSLRGPAFGHDPRRTFELADRLLRAPERVVFSIKTRADCLRPEALRLLKRAGLACVVVDAAEPDLPEPCGDVPAARDAALEEFIAACRALGIRTVAEFVAGDPHDPRQSLLRALGRARRLRPTLAEFHLLTPYPGTEWFDRHAGEWNSADGVALTRTRAVLRYEGFKPEQIERLQRHCYCRFHLRWAAVRDWTGSRWSAFVGRLVRRPGPLVAPGAGPAALPPQAAPPDAPRGKRRLRSDGPHTRPGFSDRHSERRPPE